MFSHNGGIFGSAGELPDREAARKLVRTIAGRGRVVLTGHARNRLRDRNLTTQDVLMLLLGGWVERVERGTRGELRFVVCNARTTVVIVPRSEDELVVLTAWRNER